MEQRRVSRGEGLSEPRPVGIAVEVNSPGLQGAEDARKVARRVGRVEQVRRVHPGPVRSPPVMIERIAALMHCQQERRIRLDPREVLERRTVDQCGASRSPVVHQEQVAMDEQGREQRDVQTAAPGRGKAGPSFLDDDGRQRRRLGCREPHEADVDHRRQRIAVIERHRQRTAVGRVVAEARSTRLQCCGADSESLSCRHAQGQR